MARKIALLLRHISYMHEVFTIDNTLTRAVWSRLIQAIRQILGVPRREAARCNGLEVRAIVSPHDAERCLAKPESLFEHRVEHRREVAGRRVDDLQYLSGG